MRAYSQAMQTSLTMPMLDPSCRRRWLQQVITVRRLPEHVLIIGRAVIRIEVEAGGYAGPAAVCPGSDFEQALQSHMGMTQSFESVHGYAHEAMTHPASGNATRRDEAKGGQHSGLRLR